MMLILNRTSLALLVFIGVTFGAATSANAQVVSEVGARYWYSTGQTDFDLFTSTGPPIVSRLTYDGLDAHSGEIFGKVQDTTGTFLNGLFVKGYAGLGIIPGGSLNDEDFPPFTVPYSSTISPLDNGDLAYFSADVGFTVHKSANFELGVFTGYHYWNEQLHAFGCTQIAANPGCVPPIATSVAVISNEATWQSWRLGVVGTAMLGPRVSLTGEAVWVPYTSLDNIDNHHLRSGPMGIDPLPSDGTGQGVQLEAVLDIAVTPKFSVGIGGRYWHLGPTDGFAHFELTPGGGVAQVVKFESDRYGVFIQGTFTFP